MPEIKIKIDEITRETLKQQAKSDDRSLAKYLERGLRYLAEKPGGYHLEGNNTNTKNIIDLSILPEGTKITTTTKTTPKVKIPKRNLVEEVTEGSFFPSGLRVHNDDDEPFTDEEYQQELNQLRPSVRNHPDFITLKNYYDRFNSSEEERSEARERLIALRHSKDIISHETLYLEQVFEFTPPEDEPTLDLSTYISRLLQGGWYDDCVCLRPKV